MNSVQVTATVHHLLLLLGETNITILHVLCKLYQSIKGEDVNEESTRWKTTRRIVVRL